MATFSHTVRLSASSLEWLTAKLAKWPQIEVVATPVTVKDDLDVETIVFDTRVSLNAPVLPGYTLNARIEHHDEGNIIYRCSGVENLTHRTCKAYCTHCKTQRNRLDTFILTNDATGQVEQVGRNCLAEYVRDEAAAAYLLNWADCIDRIVRVCSEAEESMGSGRMPEMFTLPFVVSWAMAWGKKWVPASQSRETGESASSGEILGLIRTMRATPKGSRWWDSKEGVFASEVAARAEALRNDQASDVYAVIAWMGALQASSDYEHNLNVIARIGYCTVKQWSLTCSAFRGWLRVQHEANAKKQEAERAARGPQGSHLGDVGKRIAIENVNCVDVKSLGVGEFGERFLVKFMSPAGDEVVWFTGEGNPFESGKSYTITGTVKEHGEFRGQKNTVLSRVVEGNTVKKGKKK